MTDVANSMSFSAGAPAGKAPVPRGTVIYALSTLALVCGLFGIGAATAPIDSAAIVSGVVGVEGQRRVVQHLDGGLIREIHVREGTRVRAGDALVTLDRTDAQTAVTILTGRLMAAEALAARLRAERDGFARIDFGNAYPDVQEAATRSGASDAAAGGAAAGGAIAGQTRIFEARREALRTRRDILQQRIGQLRAEIAGFDEQLAAHDRQRDLIRQEIGNVTPLVNKGLERKSRLLALRRAEAEIDRGAAAARSSRARAAQRIGETRLEIDETGIGFMNEVVNELRGVDGEVFDLRAQLRQAEARLERTVLTASVDGSIVDLRVTTVGGVIAPGEDVMSIVPANERVIVEARIKPDDIESVYPGLTATIRLTAFSRRTVDTVSGAVFHVSADRLSDTATREPYYLARIALDEASFPAGLFEQVIPGMGAEVMIRTGERTLLDYLLQPLRQSFARALTEE